MGHTQLRIDIVTNAVFRRDSRNRATIIGRNRVDLSLFLCSSGG